MNRSKTMKWLIVAGVAAAVAAATTAVLLFLRARSRKKAWYEKNADFGYDLEDGDVDNWDGIEGAGDETEPAAE